MNTITNHHVQDSNVLKKQPEQLELNKQGKKANESQVRDIAMVNVPKDTAEIQNPLRHSIDFNHVSGERCLKDIDEAEKLLQELIGLLKSENDKPQVYQTHDLNQGNFVQLLSQFWQ